MQSKTKEFFFVEITDTFGGEANYSWVTRLKVSAKNQRGAVQKVGVFMGLQYHKEWDNGDMTRYTSKSGSTCYFIEHWEEDQHSRYNNIKEV